MATISAKDVAALRAKTGIGMMECKKALAECNGDEEKAIKWLNNGAIPTDTVRALLSGQGVMKKYAESKSKKEGK